MRCVTRPADASWFIDNLVIEKNLKDIYPLEFGLSKANISYYEIYFLDFVW